VIERAPRFAELNQLPLSQTIVEVIRTAIVTCRLAPGAPLNQVDLARELATSRGPVREALRQLEEEGLVVHVPYKGTFVARLTRRDVEEVCSLRSVLERFAARRVVERATDAEIASLGRLVEQMEAAVAHGDWDERDSLDLSFHTRICELADHRLLLQAWDRSALQLRRALTLRNRVGDDAPRLVSMHRELYEAIRDRDLARIDAAYEHHGADLARRLADTLPDDDAAPANGRVRAAAPTAAE